MVKSRGRMGSCTMLILGLLDPSVGNVLPTVSGASGLSYYDQHNPYRMPTGQPKADRLR